MSPDELAFLDAALARPAEDAPRLVYADFLADTGSPADAARADLIRAQLALARMPDGHPQRAALVQLETELLDRHRPRWTEHLRGLVEPDGVEFRRGLPDSVAVSAALFAARGRELFDRARAPSGRAVLRRVFLKDPAAVLPRVLASPALAEVEELGLAWGELGNAGAALLARCSNLGAVRALDLSFNRIDDAGVRALAATARLPRLERLALNDNEQITWDGVTAFAASPFFGALTDLDLGRNDVTDAGVAALAASRTLPHLSALNLVGNHVGDAGVAALVGSALFRRMLARDGRIDLRANGVGPAGAEALAAAAAADLTRATALDLDKNYLGDRGTAALAGALLPKLSRLRLSRNQITDAGAFALADAIANRLPALRAIDLSGNRLTWRGGAAVRDAAFARGAVIDLTGNAADGSGEVPALPIPLADDVAELRRRVTYPASRPQ